MKRRLPAEWEPQTSLLLCWPGAEGNWGRELPAARQAWLHLAREAAEVQPLRVVCAPSELHTAEQQLRAEGTETAKAILYACPVDDCWIRDFGPITVLQDGSPLLLDFCFDGWGGKQPAARSAAVTARLHACGAFAETPLERIPLTLEGGALESDGLGTLLCTPSSLQGGCRNPGLGRAVLARLLKKHLGCERVLWLERGSLHGDDTDGHVDLLARFADPSTILYAGAESPDHPDHIELVALAECLRDLRKRNGDPYELRLLPMPQLQEQGSSLPASYLNFLILEKKLLVPAYGVARTDDTALGILREMFPGHVCSAIDCRALIRQGGALHCLATRLAHGDVA